MANPDDLLAVCSECHSDQPDSYVEKNIFYRQGGNVPCKFCGGVCFITTYGSRDNAIKQSDRDRGL